MPKVSGDTVLLAALDAKPVAKKARVEELPPSVAPERAGDSDSSVAGDVISSAEKKVSTTSCPASELSPTPRSPTGTRSTSSSASSASIAGDLEHEDADGFPDTLCGVPLQRVAERTSHGWTYHSRLQLKCPHHEGCRKSRSVMLDAAAHGRHGVLIFLGAWLSRHDLGAGAHARHKPTAEEMRAFAETF